MSVNRNSLVCVLVCVCEGLRILFWRRWKRVDGEVICNTFVGGQDLGIYVIDIDTVDN